MDVSSLLHLLVLPALGQAPLRPALARAPVTVELRNGSRIEGALAAEEPDAWVIAVSGGEVRLKKSTVLRVAAVQDPPDAIAGQRDGAPEAPPPRVELELSGPAPMSFQAPAAWVETRLEGRELALKDPEGALVFGVTTVADSSSLWSLARAVKVDYGRLYGSFAAEHERFAARGDLRSWELEFRYVKDGMDFREIHLFLDLGAVKRIFTFTARAPRFDDLVPAFRSIVASFRFPAAGEEGCEGVFGLSA